MTMLLFKTLPLENRFKCGYGFCYAYDIQRLVPGEIDRRCRKYYIVKVFKAFSNFLQVASINIRVFDSLLSNPNRDAFNDFEECRNLLQNKAGFNCFCGFFDEVFEFEHGILLFLCFIDFISCLYFLLIISFFEHLFYLECCTNEGHEGSCKAEAIADTFKIFLVHDITSLRSGLCLFCDSSNQSCDCCCKTHSVCNTV